MCSWSCCQHIPVLGQIWPFSARKRAGGHAHTSIEQECKRFGPKIRIFEPRSSPTVGRHQAGGLGLMGLMGLMKGTHSLGLRVPRHIRKPCGSPRGRGTHKESIFDRNHEIMSSVRFISVIQKVSQHLPYKASHGSSDMAIVNYALLLLPCNS